MIRTAVLLGLALAVSACNKDKPADAPASTPASKATSAAPASQAASKAAPASAAAKAPGTLAPASVAALAKNGAPPAAAPASASPAARANAEETIKLMEEMGKVMAAANGDCDKMGEGLEGFVTKNKARMEAAKAGNKDLTPEERRAAIAPFQQRMQAAMMQIMGPGMKCKDHPRVDAAMKSM